MLISLIFSSNILWSKTAGDDPCKGMNHPAYQDEYRTCLRTQLVKKAQESGVDCETCFADQDDNGPSNVSQAVQILTQPVLQLALTAAVTKFQNQMQERAANNYVEGFKACTNRFNSFLNYNTTIGANPISASQAQYFSDSCNGQGYGSYAGFGGLMSNGLGGFGNPFLTQGYSSQFMSAYGGPFASANSSIYGNGMTAGALGVGAYGGFNFGAQTSSGVYQNTSSSSQSSPTNSLNRVGF